MARRFDLPVARVIATSLVQLVCAWAVLRPRYANSAALVLSFTTIGAIGVHLRIGSPLTSLGAVGFTLVQLAFLRLNSRR